MAAMLTPPSTGSTSWLHATQGNSSVSGSFRADVPQTAYIIACVSRYQLYPLRASIATLFRWLPCMLHCTHQLNYSESLTTTAQTTSTADSPSYLRLLYSAYRLLARRQALMDLRDRLPLGLSVLHRQFSVRIASHEARLPDSTISPTKTFARPDIDCTMFGVHGCCNTLLMSCAIIRQRCVQHSVVSSLFEYCLAGNEIS